MKKQTMKKRMEIKLKAVFVFDVEAKGPEDESLIETLAETPLAIALAYGLRKHGLKVTAVEKADRTITDLDRQLPPERRVRVRAKKAG